LDLIQPQRVDPVFIDDSALAEVTEAEASRLYKVRR
jgi:hypothetical protein